LFDWYLLLPFRARFVVSGLVAWRSSARDRHLYGAALETLLATWGLSLFLIQAVRTIFGP
jgi:urea transport system permease protein